MSKRNDGGPAFPESGERGNAASGEGMSLRDYFAIEALKGVGTWMPEYEANGKRVGAYKSICNPIMQRARARWAYAQADAMLEERDK